VPGGDGTHVPRLPLEIAVVVLLLLTGVAHWGDLGDRLGIAAPDPFEEPAAVEPPGGVDLPPPAAARPVAARVRGGDLDPAAVGSAVDRLSRGRRLGPRLGLLVTEVDGTPVHRSGPRVLTPASTTKLLTAAAALEAIGPQARFETSVRRAGRTLVLVGGGDPLLERAPEPDHGYPEERADLRTLARLVAERLEGTGPQRFRLRYDTSLFSGPEVSPDWRADYVPDNVVSPITPLWADQGRVPDGFGARQDDPAQAAADLFADHLRAAGVRVRRPDQGVAPEGAAKVAGVRSAPVGEIVQHLLETSDNEAAEVMLRQVAIARGLPATFTDGVRAVRDVLAELGVRLARARWYDGSGLSRRNRLSPDTLVDILVTALDRPRLARVAAGLPVAGFNGSLSERFAVRSDPGLGRVRAKTGTLTGVSALAGLIRSRDGAVMLYVAIADRVRETNTLWARARLDRLSAALAGCRCRVGS
jgi:serine-type D-Ala-D-Ala carboxypeptidase/endopeptidase (penicillin-binding protein 4)